MFHAFLSYSHRADAALARLLHRALERLGTPWWRRASVRVFRDDATLAATPALWPSIEAGLAQSQSFVLLASPSSATSPWVEREVRWWLDHRPREQLFIVVTGGEISYESGIGDFDWVSTTCLPPALRGVFPSEPLWVDLRFAGEPRPLTLGLPQLRSAVLSLVAAVRGMSKDQLESEDLRSHQRSVAVAWGVTALIGLLGISTATSVLIARSESENARANRLQAESRRLASAALVDLARGAPGVEPAVLKAALAWRISPTQEAREALSQIDATTAAVARVLGRHTGGGVVKISLSPDGRVLATAGREGAVLRWDTTSGRQLSSAMGTAGWPDHLQHSRDGTHLLLKSHQRVGDKGSDEEVELPRLALFRLADNVSVPLPENWLDWLAPSGGGLWGGSACATLSADGALVAVARDDRIAVIRVADGFTARHRMPPRLRVGGFAFRPDRRLVLLAVNVHGDGAHAAHLAEPLRGGSAFTVGPRNARAGGDCRFTGASADGRRLVTGGQVWQISENLALQSLLSARELQPRELTGHHAPEPDSAGRLVAVGRSGTGYVLDVDTGKIVFKTPKQRNSHGPSLALSSDGSRLAGLLDGTPVIWALDGSVGQVELKKPDCGESIGSRSAEHCIARVCERLTANLDSQRWKELLGPAHHELLATARELRCSGT